MSPAAGASARAGRLALLVALFLAITLLVPRPEAVTAAGWRTFAIFFCVIAGMVVQPLPGAALVVIGLAAMTANGIPMREALGGYAEPSVWLVLAAMLMARAIFASGLARRIALLFIRRFGHSSLGIAYALVMTDVTLASGVPSITARSAGMVLPVGRSIAELFDSLPGRDRTAARPLSAVGDVPGLGRRLRDVPHRPGEQRARRGPGGQARRGRGDLVGVAGRRAGAGTRVVSRGAVGGAQDGAARGDRARPKRRRSPPAS